MKNRPYNIFITAAFILFTILPLQSSAQAVLDRTIVTKKGRTILYFNEMPDFTSSLSDDKKKVVIKIKNADAKEGARVVNSSGLIESVYAQTSGGDLTISIILRKKEGYTIAPMPFSNSLIVEVFSWDKLSPDEDNYRSGVLALENKIYPTAENYFQKAAADGNINSKALLGILKLQNSDLDSALILMKEAEKGNSDIYDIYAALSQIYELNGDQKNATKYKNLFSKKTSLDDFPRLVVDYEPEDNADGEEPVSFLQSIAEEDEKTVAANEKVAAKDTLSESRQFENLFNNDTTQAKKQAGDSAAYSFLDGGIDTLFIYILSFILVLAVIIIYLFIRWRKKQMLLASKEDRQEFKKRLAEAREEVRLRQQYAESKAGKAGVLIDKTDEPDEGTLIKDTEQEKYVKAAKRSKIQSKGKTKTDEIKTDETKTDEPAADENGGEDAKISKTESIEEVDLTGATNKSRGNKSASSARIEMALNLAEEQRKVKTKKLESLQQQSIFVDAGKLSDVSRKLGIEKGGLEIKLQVEKMQSDKKSLSKLADKFSVDKNKSQRST